MGLQVVSWTAISSIDYRRAIVPSSPALGVL